MGAFGERLGGHFRVGETRALVSKSVRKVDFAVTRVRSDAPDHGLTSPIPREPAFLIAMQLRDLTDYRFWEDGRAIDVEMQPAGATTMVDLDRCPVTYLASAFDTLQIYVPHAALESFATDNGVPLSPDYRWRTCARYDDPIVRHLALSLLPMLERPQEANQIFVDCVAAALHAHLVGEYRGLKAAPPMRGGLARWQLQRATEMLSAAIDGEIALSSLAAACELSPSQFRRAFKISTGQSPHRWLLARRVDMAKSYLLSTGLPLAQIAVTCGFADQSHFTRVFRHFLGVSPGSWRRDHRK